MKNRETNSVNIPYHLWTVVLLLGLALVGCGPRLAEDATRPTQPSAAAAATVLHIYPTLSRVAFTAQALGERLQVEGTYGILGGTVTLTPESDQLRIRAYLEIDTPSVTVGSPVIDEALRLGMETELYPVAIFDATSTELVPVTEEEVSFDLAGTLTLHGQTRPVFMTVGPATVIRNHLESDSQMTFNLGDFGITLPEAVVSGTIALNVHLSADLTPPPTPTPPGEEGS